MRRTLAVSALLMFGAGGYAVAGVTPGGDTNGSVTRGQSLTFTVSDSFSGNPPGGPPYARCTSFAQAVASGWVAVGPLGPSQGGHQADLTVSCNASTWTYSGTITVTVPDDAPPTMPASVAVQERVPVQAAETGCSCVHIENYSANYTYTVAAPPTTTATTNAGTTSTTTTAAASPPASTQTQSTTQTPQDTTGPPPAAPAPVVQTVSQPTTVTVTQTTPVTITTTTSVAAVPVSHRFVLEMPAAITVKNGGPRIRLTVTSNDRRTSQTLCWRASSMTRQTCAVGHGTWPIKLDRIPGKQIFVLKVHGKVVARKTTSIKRAA